MDTRSRWQVSAALLWLALGAACDRGEAPKVEAAAPPPPSCPEPPKQVCPEPPPPPPLGLGKLDRAFFDRALAMKKREKLELKVNLDGSIGEIELYHGDPEALPQVVRDLAEKTFPKGKVLHYETEVDAGGDIFEVEVDFKGKECEVSARADGTLLYTECEESTKDLGPILGPSVAKGFPGAKVVGLKKISRPEAESFEVELMIDGEEHEVEFDAAGQVTAHVRKIPAVLEIAVP